MGHRDAPVEACLTAGFSGARMFKRAPARKVALAKKKKAKMVPASSNTSKVVKRSKNVNRLCLHPQSSNRYLTLWQML